jgi:hypothetical protein
VRDQVVDGQTGPAQRRFAGQPIESDTGRGSQGCERDVDNGKSAVTGQHADLVIG